MPLSGLYNERVHVGGCEGLWREKQGSSWGSSSRSSLTFMPLSELFEVRVYVGGSKGSSLGGARDCVRSY